MGLTVTKGKTRRVGKNIVHNFNIVFDDSYATGGEALPASARGDGWDASIVKHVNILPSGNYEFLYDESEDKIAVWTGGSEVSDTTDLSSVSTSAEVVAVR